MYCVKNKINFYVVLGEAFVFEFRNAASIYNTKPCMKNVSSSTFFRTQNGDFNERKDPQLC